jgi:hypothetical protein
VVPTEDSGLFGKAQPYVDKFDHWPEESKKNKARMITYTCIGYMHDIERTC